MNTHARLLRPAAVYVLVSVIGAAAFLYPFWLPSTALSAESHATDAPLLAALIGALAITAMALEVARGSMNGATIAVLGVLSAMCALLRLLELPGGGNAMFFLVVLAGGAFGARFGLLLGLCSMATSAVITGGVGPWLPFQMLALAWMASGAGFTARAIAALLRRGRLSTRAGERLDVAVLAAYAWIWAFLYGAIMNLWFWPFARDNGPVSWHPGLGLHATLSHYWHFYVLTSFAWDAAGATTNVIFIALIGIPVLRALRRVAHRLSPVVELVDTTDDRDAPAELTPAGPPTMAAAG